MSIRIGNIVIPKSPNARYKIDGYTGGATIAIRGYVEKDEEIKLAESQLYLLRDGSVIDVEIVTDDGISWTGLYRINELSWRKEMKSDGNYELMFNIGLQKKV